MHCRATRKQSTGRHAARSVLLLLPLFARELKQAEFVEIALCVLLDRRHSHGPRSGYSDGQCLLVIVGVRLGESKARVAIRSGVCFKLVTSLVLTYILISGPTT